MELLAFGFYMRRGLPNIRQPSKLQYDYVKN